MESPRPTAEHAWLAGSCVWQVGDYAVHGGDFVGHGMMGYDTGQKKFVGSWADTASTVLHRLEGQLDPGGRVLRVTASFVEPTSGKETTMEEITERIDANHRRFTIMRAVNGTPMKALEMDYTRDR